MYGADHTGAVAGLGMNGCRNSSGCFSSDICKSGAVNVSHGGVNPNDQLPSERTDFPCVGASDERKRERSERRAPGEEDRDS